MRRVVIATTGISYILTSLSQNSEVEVIGVLDFQHMADDCAHLFLDTRVNYWKYDNNIDSLKKWLIDLHPDLMVIYKMPFLLPVDIFSIPQFGCINIHPSLLPKYRGPNPWFWIYYNMERTSGMTIHKINESEDSGDILAQVKFRIKLGDKLCCLQLKAEQKIYPLLLKLIQEIETVKGIPQHLIENTLRGCNISSYHSLLNLKEIDGIQLWHLLKGFPWLLPIITQTSDCNYKIEEFSAKTVPDENQIGSIIEKKAHVYLYCRNGIIRLNKF